MSCNDRLNAVILSDKTQDEGSIEVPMSPYAGRFMITARGTGVGKILFEIAPHELSGYEYLIDTSTKLQREIDLESNDLSFILTDIFINRFKVTPVGVDGSYTLYFQQAQV